MYVSLINISLDQKMCGIVIDECLLRPFTHIGALAFASQRNIVYHSVYLKLD